MGDNPSCRRPMQPAHCPPPHDGGALVVRGYIEMDQNEPISIALYLSDCLDVERKLLNRPAPEPKPDYVFLNYEGKFVGVSRKQGGEWLGTIDSTEAQLLEEMGNVDYMALLIEGWFAPATDDSGGSYSWAPSLKSPTIAYQNRHYPQSHKGMRMKLASLHDKGILILQTANELDTAITLIALYEEEQKPLAERTTFNRLTKEHYWIQEANLAKKDFALSLMGIRNARVGEEIALALADRFDTIAQLVNTLEAGADAEIAKLPLRHARRTVGPAAVSRLKGALGI